MVSNDVYLTKFDPDGNFKWARTWGGNEQHSVATDFSGNVYVWGFFTGAVDFDPGPGEDIHTSKDINSVYSSDAYLSKFDSNGNFVWAKTWGGGEGIASYALAIDSSGYIYTAGDFTGSNDFDPGPGTEINDSDPYTNDVYLSKFDLNGNFLWVRVWGGSSDDYCRSVAIDGSGSVYVAGFFTGKVDFERARGRMSMTAARYSSFLSKFDSSGNFVRAIWGGDASCPAYVVAIDGSGNTYVTGDFRARWILILARE